MTTITFMRHAQTEYNTKGLFCGTSDCSITLVVTRNGFLRELARLIGVPPVTKNLEYLTVDSSLLIFKE